MKKYILSCMAAAVMLFAASSAFAQKGGNVLNPEEAGGWLIGPIGGLNLVTYSTDKFAILQSEPTCFEAQNGSDVAPFFGISALIPLNAEEMQSFIVAEVVFDSKSSKFTGINDSRTNVPTKLNGVEAPGSVVTSSSAALNYLDINVGYKYNFTQGPTPVGPSVELLGSVGLKMTASETKSVTVSAAYVGETNVANTANLANPSGIRIGLRAIFTYDIPLTDMWVASPLAGYDLGFTKVSSGAPDPTNWKANSAFFGISVRALVGR